MAIEKKLIHFGKLADFEAQLTAGNILDYSIVFIQDAKKIWTHGTYYDCSEGTATGDEFWDEDLNGNAFCDRDILVDGNVRTNGAVVTSSIGVPLEEGGFVTGDRGQILIATGEGTVEWDDLSIPTKVSDLEDDRGLVSEQFARDLFIGRDKSNAGCEVANFDQIFSPDISLLYALPASANGEEDDVLLSRDSVKTINGESIYGGGDITIDGGSLTESDIVAMGFTKNTGTYSKPSGGIPKSDLASAVQTSLGKADTALSVNDASDLYVSKSSVKDVDNSIVIDANIFIDPSDGIFYGLPSMSEHCDDVIATKNTLKTINGQSIVGSGNITISGGGVSEDYVNTAIANAITTTLNTAV